MHSNTDWREEEVRLWLARLIAGKHYDVVQRLAIPSIWISPSSDKSTTITTGARTNIIWSSMIAECWKDACV